MKKKHSLLVKVKLSNRSNERCTYTELVQLEEMQCGTVSVSFL